jgi:spore germination protein KC
LTIKKLFQYFLVLGAIVGICFSFTGCIPSHQLNETAIVQAIGLDLEEGTGNYKITLQIYSPKGAGASTAIDTSKNNSSVITTSGKTISSAMRDATVHQGKSIFSGHNRIIVIGRSLAEKGIEEIFSYFNRDPLTRLNVPVMMADQTAEEIVTTNIDQGILAAETIRDILDNSQENGYVYTCPYYLLAKNMSLYEGCGAIPVVSFSDQKQEDDNSIPLVTNLQIRNTAVFKNYQWVGDLDESQTRGLVLLSDQMEKTVLLPEGHNSVGIYQCNASLKPEITEDQTVQFHLKVRAKAALEERGEEEEIPLTQLQNQSAQLLEQEVQQAFGVIVNQYGADILYLKDLMIQEDVQFWEQQEDAFASQFSDIKLTTDIQVSIDRVGLETETAR